jgi:hypothetical protein
MQEDEGSMFLRNFGVELQYHIVSKPKTIKSELITIFVGAND